MRQTFVVLVVLVSPVIWCKVGIEWERRMHCLRSTPTTFKMIEAVDVDAARVGNPSGKLRLVIETDDGRKLGESEWKDATELPKNER